MKTEFSNAEKVSSFYLRTQFDKVKQRLERYEYLLTEHVAYEYLSRLEKIQNRENLDNYEKLKQLIHVEREWNEYISSKQVFLDAIRNLALNDLEDHYMRQNLGWVFECIEFVHSKTPYSDNIDNYYFYPEEENLSLQSILPSLTEEDILSVKEDMKKYYQKLFLVIVNRTKHLDAENCEYIISFLKGSFDNRVINEEHYQMVKNSFWEAYEKLYFEKVSSCIAKPFFIAIQEAVQNNNSLLLEKSFWDILLYVIGEKDILDKIFFQDDGEEISVEANNLHTLKKVSQEDVSKIFSEPVLMNLDLRDVDLSSYNNLNVFHMKNCNLKGNHTTKISFSSDVKKIYYVRGVSIDFYDLTNSCFQGCRIMKLESLFPFTFSSQTFDEEVIKKHGMYLSEVSDNIREKYYRGNPLTKKEIIEVLQNNSSDMLKSRYQEIHQESNLLLLFQLNDLIPGIVQKIVTE